MHKLSPEEEQIQQQAINFVKENRTKIANDLLAACSCTSEKNPLVIFMAGAPGAGKTEVSTILAQMFNARRMPKLLRVDPDEFREKLPGYTGNNSHLFQPAVVKVVERLLDKLWQKKFSFILDGTFSSIDVARKNVQRALKNNYRVVITYVYQEPAVSWQFVQAREVDEGRRIEKNTFIKQFFTSNETANQIKKEFGEQVRLDVLAKNYNNSDATSVTIDAEKIDEKFVSIYTETALLEMLK